MDSSTLPLSLSIPTNDNRQKPRFMWVLPISPLNNQVPRLQNENCCPLRCLSNGAGSSSQQFPRSWNLGNGSRLWAIPVPVAKSPSPALSESNLSSEDSGPEQGIPVRESKSFSSQPWTQHAEDNRQTIPVQRFPYAPTPTQMNIYPLATVGGFRTPMARAPPSSSLPAPRTAECRRDPPKDFRFVPSFVSLAQRLRWDLFPRFVQHFFDTKAWPLFHDNPPHFQEYCTNFGVGPDNFEYLPGFAPEWVFHLRMMNESLFWDTIHYFFEHKVFPSWSSLPSTYINWFKRLKLGEYDFPETKNKYSVIPDKFRKYIGNFMENRLRLTRKNFHKKNIFAYPDGA